MKVTSNEFFVYCSTFLPSFLPSEKDLCPVWSCNSESHARLGHLKALCWDAMFLAPGSEFHVTLSLFRSAGNEIMLLVAQELLQVLSGCSDSWGGCWRWLWWSMAPVSHGSAG